MDLRKLEHFLAVADHGGFSAGARATFISQPALSLAVRELEAELGTALFVRAGRRCTLTAAGESLLGPARRALQEVALGRAAVDAVKGLTAGTLRLTALPTLSVDPLASMIGSFRRHHVAVSLAIVPTEHVDAACELVRSGACELALVDAHELADDLVAVSLAAQTMVLVVPDAGSAEPITSVEQIADLPFIATQPGTSTRRLLDQSFATIGRSPRVAVETAQRDAILPLVLAGAGVALLPASLGEMARRLGGGVRTFEPPVSRRVALVHRPGSLSPAGSAFVVLCGGD